MRIGLPVWKWKNDGKSQEQKGFKGMQIAHVEKGPCPKKPNEHKRDINFHSENDMMMSSSTF